MRTGGFDAPAWEFFAAHPRQSRRTGRNESPVISTFDLWRALLNENQMLFHACLHQQGIAIHSIVAAE
jgi:hypothetical protein